jgi:hypothetical protein
VTTLHLGVSDVPYSPPPKAAKTKNKVTSPASKTTGDVAEILEAKYHIMQTFLEYGQQGTSVTDLLTDSIRGALENHLSGAPITNNPFGEATEKLQSKFNDFITYQTMDRLGIPNVPTLAALHGVSHRFKHPYARRPARPSFVDTGLFLSSFRAWVD